MSPARIPARVYHVTVGRAGLSSPLTGVGCFLMGFRLVCEGIVCLALLGFRFNRSDDSSRASSAVTTSTPVPSRSTTKLGIATGSASICIFMRCLRGSRSTASAPAPTSSRGRGRISAFNRRERVRRTGHPAAKSGKAEDGARFRLSGNGQSSIDLPTPKRIFFDYPSRFFVRREKPG